MSLVEFIDLFASLLLADHGLAFIVLISLQHPVIVQLVFFLLLLFLFKLKAHELDFLFGNGTIFHGLRLERFIFSFDLLHELFKLLNPLCLFLVPQLLRMNLVVHFRLVSLLQGSIC